MSWKNDPDLAQFFDAIMTLNTQTECLRFFEDVCTIKELTDMAKRLEAARMLKTGMNYSEVAEKTGMSTATISRVNKCLKYGDGGYATALDRLEKGRKP